MNYGWTTRPDDLSQGLEAGSGRSGGASRVWPGNDTFGFLLAPGMRTSSLANILLTFRSVIEIPAH